MSSSGPGRGSQRPAVLLVDDEPVFLETTSAVLASSFDTSTAMGGSDALAFLRANSVDVVCSDYSMPGMNGVDLLERVALLPGFIGRVLVTGAREHRSLWEPRLAGELYYIVLKPFSPRQLLDVVQRAAAQTALRRTVHRARSAALQSLADLRDATDASRPPEPGSTGVAERPTSRRGR